jgi:hypothetical protein
MEVEYELTPMTCTPCNGARPSSLLGAGAALVVPKRASEIRRRQNGSTSSAEPAKRLRQWSPAGLGTKSWSSHSFSRR